MKKTIILFSAVALGIFTSCNNDNTVNPKEELGSATITGTVYADLNTTADGLEKVANVKIVAKVHTSDLVGSTVETNYGYQYIETVTDANGKYSLTVPANKNNAPYDVRVIPADFQFNVVLSSTTTQSVNFIGGAGSDVSVYNAGTFIHDISYND